MGIAFSKGDGSWQHFSKNTVPTYIHKGGGIAMPGDYNGDGKSDILWRNSATGQNWMYLMDGATIASSLGVNTVPGPNWGIVNVN